MRRREQRTESAESECGVCFLQYAATEQRERGTIVKRGESGARGGSLAKAGRLTPCPPSFFFLHGAFLLVSRGAGIAD